MRLALQAAFLAVLTIVPAAARAGTITRVIASPAAVVVGQTVTFTEEGTNPCGAANLNYADGIVITYAIAELPAHQTHAFEKPGNYTVIARGMGNCDGEATTTVVVKPAATPPAPPPPAPAAPHVTAIEFVPSPGIARQAVGIDVKGEGPCRFVARFGDGNSQEYTADLPRRIEHTYALTGAYTVVVAPVPPCTGRFTERLQVVARSAAPRLTDLAIQPSPADAGEPVTIRIRGTGSCSYAIDFGDGNNDSRTAVLPDALRHNYPASGDYLVNATAIPPCTGSARRTLRVFEPRRVMSPLHPIFQALPLERMWFSQLPARVRLVPGRGDKASKVTRSLQ